MWGRCHLSWWWIWPDCHWFYCSYLWSTQKQDQVRGLENCWPEFPCPTQDVEDASFEKGLHSLTYLSLWTVEVRCLSSPPAQRPAGPATGRLSAVAVPPRAHFSSEADYCWPACWEWGAGKKRGESCQINTHRCVMWRLYCTVSASLGPSASFVPLHGFTVPAFCVTVIYQLPRNFWARWRSSLVSLLFRSQLPHWANHPNHI